MRAQFIGAQRTVQAHGNRLGVRDGVPERFHGLSRQRAAAFIGDGAGNHDRQFQAAVVEILARGEDGCLAVQGVEHGFNQDDVRAAFHQMLAGFVVVAHQFVPLDRAFGRLVHIADGAGGLGGGAEYAGYEARFVGCAGGIAQLAGEAGGFAVQLWHQIFQMVVGHRGARGVKGASFDDVCARI